MDTQRLIKAAALGAALWCGCSAYSQTASLGSAEPFVNARMGFNTNRGGTNSAGNPFDEPQAVSMLSAQQANLMRFPGGDVGNRYNWRTDYVTGTNAGTLGRQAFFKLCASMGADAVLVANMFGPNDDPENWTAQEMIDEAVAWLRYMNTPPYPYAAQGYNKPVRHWELGNEFYYASYWARTNPDVTNPSEYLTFAKNMADALQAAQNSIDPSVDLFFIVVGKAPGQFRNPTTANDATADSWANALGAVSPRWFDAVQFHPYINNRNWNAASQPFGVNDAEIKWYFSATHNMPSLLTRYLTDAVDASVQMWVTEYGTGVIPVTTDATMNTWMNALADADLILGFADEADMATALLRHQVYTSRFGLFHYTAANTLYRTPWSYVTEVLNPIFTDATDSFPVATTGIATFTGSFQFNGAGTPANTVLGLNGARYPYEPNIPEVRVRAFRMPDGKTKIALVNKVATARSITLSGAAAYGSGTRWQMSGALGAKNDGSSGDIAPSAATSITLSSGNSTVTLPGYSLTVLTLTSSAPLPVVTVAASDSAAGEPAATGTFTFTRTGSTAASLTVNYSVAGTASSGSDYTSLGTSVTIPAGSASTTRTVTPIDDTVVENAETVVLTVGANAAYSVGSPSAATVTIADNDTAGNPVTVTLYSTGANDGYVTESTETSNVGGSNAAGGTGSAALRVGDTATDQQVKTILSFDTSSIPDGATITGVTLRLQRGSVNGTSPFGTHGGVRVDVRSGAFGAVTLENADFQAAASATNVATLSAPAANGDWASGALSSSALAFVNKTGTTQFRVYCATDDNNDNGRDDVGFYPGEGAAGTRPELIVTYTP